jgi:hypothetical protein
MTAVLFGEDQVRFADESILPNHSFRIVQESAKTIPPLARRPRFRYGGQPKI